MPIRRSSVFASSVVGLLRFSKVQSLTLSRENYHAYRLRVGKGQKLFVHLASPIKAARFLLSMPDDTTADNGSGEAELKDWEGEIPASGDIVITIYHRGTQTRMPYTLEVTVR